MRMISPRDYPTIQVIPIMHGHTSPIFGSAKDVPEIARLLQEQAVIVAEEHEAVQAAEEALSKARRKHTAELNRYDNIEKYMTGVIREAAKEVLRSEATH